MLPAVDVEAVQLFTSLLAVLAGAGAVALGTIRLVARSSEPVAAFVKAIDDIALWLAFVVAAGATAGSLYFSEHAHYIPCNLCWYQRIAMYPLSLLLLIAAIRRDHSVRWYVGPLAGAGAVLSSYHYLVEWFPSLESEDVCSVSVPCTAPWFRELGFVTLSFMALCGFLFILVLVVPRRPAADLVPEAP